MPLSGSSSLSIEAINAGYRLIDTAEGRDNETGLGRAIQQCGMDHSQLFITSKLRNVGHSYDDAVASFDKTMWSLGLDQLDMFLIH